MVARKIAPIVACLVASTNSAFAAEHRETIAGWSVEERQNPDEPRDFSVRMSRNLGEVSFVYMRSAVTGREANLSIANCTSVGLSLDSSGSGTVADNISSIRNSVADELKTHASDCNTKPGSDGPLLAGIEDAMRATEDKYRADRPHFASSDHHATQDGWALDDVVDESESGSRERRLVTLTKTVGDVKLIQSLKVSMFFDDLFGVNNQYAIQSKDCKSSNRLPDVDKDIGVVTAEQRKLLGGALDEIGRDCPFPAEAKVSLLAGYDAALRTTIGWISKRLADKVELTKKMTDYEGRLAGSAEGQPAATMAMGTAEPVDCSGTKADVPQCDAARGAAEAADHAAATSATKRRKRH